MNLNKMSFFMLHKLAIFTLSFQYEIAAT